MIRNFPPNYDPNLFSMVAAIAGAIVVGDFDDYELNSIGNWIILFGQYLLTFASQQQLILILGKLKWEEVPMIITKAI